MLDCLILGDSIAVGTQQTRPECAVIAKSGINSKDWVNKNINKKPYQAKTVIISLGSNDYRGINTEQELQTIRNQTQATRVYWILPAIKADIQAIVKKVAQEHHDTVLHITHLSADKVHPTYQGYKLLGKQAK
jgi:lysophospholipase L1-like esterase